jgi:hypothetical protein
MNAEPRAGAGRAIAILGKSQGTKRDNKQLEARVGLAAALWHAAPPPKPLVLYVAAHDVPAVEALLAGRYAVPPESTVTRWASNCTFVEVRELRDAGRLHGVERMVGVTHPYHAPRTERYLREVLPHSSVVAVRPGALAGLSLPDAAAFAALAELIRASQPGPLDAAREHVVEGTLRAIHALDPAGHTERALANLVRVPMRRPG